MSGPNPARGPTRVRRGPNPVRNGVSVTSRGGRGRWDNGALQPLGPFQETGRSTGCSCIGFCRSARHTPTLGGPAWGVGCGWSHVGTPVPSGPTLTQTPHTDTKTSSPPTPTDHVLFPFVLGFGDLEQDLGRDPREEVLRRGLDGKGSGRTHSGDGHRRPGCGRGAGMVLEDLRPSRRV